MEEGKISQYAAPLVFAAGISHAPEVSADKPNAGTIETLYGEMAVGQPILNLNAKQWEDFQAMLDEPVQDNPRLRALLAEPGCVGGSPLGANSQIGGWAAQLPHSIAASGT